MSQYAFVTSWLLEALLEVVWDAIYQVEQWARVVGPMSKLSPRLEK